MYTCNRVENLQPILCLVDMELVCRMVLYLDVPSDMLDRDRNNLATFLIFVLCNSMAHLEVFYSLDKFRPKCSRNDFICTLHQLHKIFRKKFYLAWWTSFVCTIWIEISNPSEWTRNRSVFSYFTIWIATICSPV